MRVLLLLMILLGTCACGLNGGVQRRYVITHSLLEDVDLEEVDLEQEDP